VFCDGKAVVLPSAKEGVAAVGSCQIIKDFIRGGWLSKSPGMWLFWCKPYLNNITRWFAKFGVKRTSPVAWAESQSKFGTGFSRIEPPHPNQSIFSPQNTTGVLLLQCPISGCAENRIWRNFVFHPFWHPFRDFFKVNGWKRVSHQPLGLFTPLFLQWCSFGKRTSMHQKIPNLVQWVIWCGEMAVKSRVHAMKNWARAPERARFKLRCKQKFRAVQSSGCQD